VRATSSTVLGWAVIIAVSVLAGLLAQAASVPAGWLVGPMLVAVAAALAWPGSPTVPRLGRVAALAVVGGVLAAAFRPSVLPLIARHWLPVLLVTCGTLAVSLAAGLLLGRIARLDRRTAALGSLPGAASGMLAMSGPLGADPRLVAVMQYTRVVAVVFSAAAVSRFGVIPGTAPRRLSGQGSPDAAQGAAFAQDALPVYALTVLVAALGAWAGMRLRLPAGALLGPLVLGVVLEQFGGVRLAWPPGVPQTAFLILGLWVGLTFDRASVVRAGRLFPVVVASSVGLVVACAGLGWVFAMLTGIDGLTAYLATTPGGIDSVAVMALGSGADAPLVLAVQTLRLLAVILAGAFLGRWWA
jgi:uncharacterized protein